MEKRISSWEMSKIAKVQHRNLTRLINKYIENLLQIDIVTSIEKINGQSRPIVEYKLTPDQWAFVICRTRTVIDYFNVFNLLRSCS